MRKKEMKVWDGKDEVELEFATFSALEQLRFGAAQNEIEEIQKKQNELEKKLEQPNYKPTKEEQKQVTEFMELAVRKMADIVINSLAKCNTEYRPSIDGNNVKDLQNKVMNMLDMKEMGDIISFVFGGEELMRGFPEK